MKIKLSGWWLRECSVGVLLLD